jgi:hypothetical protein
MRIRLNVIAKYWKENVIVVTELCQEFPEYVSGQLIGDRESEVRETGISDRKFTIFIL